jgi:hypothetical protein
MILLRDPAKQACDSVPLNALAIAKAASSCIVGYPYLGIISGLPVTRPQSGVSANVKLVHRRSMGDTCVVDFSSLC